MNNFRINKFQKNHIFESDFPSKTWFFLFTTITYLLLVVNRHPAQIAVKGATVTRPKEPITVCMISAATYL